ncbi:MAG: AI-2E family transporter [Lachnospiraceae bacterium]|nr:AI-2E family transporter [Lachnospiraceae bacterium]
MKKWEEILEKRWVANLVAVCGGVLLYMLLDNFGIISEKVVAIFRMLSPIIVGLVMAYLIDPIAKFFDQKVFRMLKDESRRWGLSVIFAIIFVVILIALFIISLVPSLIDSFNLLVANLENYAANIDGIIAKINDLGIPLNLKLNLVDIIEYIEDTTDDLLNYIVKNMNVILKTSQNIGVSLFNGAVGFIFGIYFLLGKKNLLAGGNELRQAAMKEQTFQKHNEFWNRCHEIFIRYIGYNLLDGMIVGVVNGIVMLILQMPYVTLISVVVGVTNLLPTFGPIIGAVIGAFILVLNRPVYALWFLILTIVLQTVDGYVLKPKMFGGSMGIPPVWTLIAIIIGGKLFGVMGIFLAIPVAAVISFLYKERFLPWLKNRKQTSEKEEPVESVADSVEESEQDVSS